MDEFGHIGSANNFFGEFKTPELVNKNIKYEMHIFPKGGHGNGLGLDRERFCEWAGQCAGWLKT